jgi:transposase
MGRRKSTSEVNATLLVQAQADLKNLREGKVAMRLVAIVALGQGRTLQEVAGFMGVVRQRPAEWVRLYKAHGVKGLEDRAKGHRQARLTQAQEARVKGWVSRGLDPDGRPVHWTIQGLRVAMEERLDVRYGKTRVWELLRKWGYRLKVPRPRHAKADPAAQRAFKKTPPARG